MKANLYPMISLFVLQTEAMQPYLQVQRNEKLIQYAITGNFQYVQWFLASGAEINYQQTHRHQLTPLLAAAEDARLDICKFLIENHANVNSTDAYGNTPLMKCVKAKGFFVLKALLKAGADPNKANNTGKTALVLAFSYQQEPAIDMLLPFALYTPTIEEIQESRTRIFITLLSLQRLTVSKDLAKIIISHLGLDVSRLVVSQMDRHATFPAYLRERAQKDLPQLTVAQLEQQLNRLSSTISMKKNDPKIIEEGIAKRFENLKPAIQKSE